MIAQAFTENGATVFISSRDAKQCEAAAAQLTANHGPGKCVALPADLSKLSGCIELAASLRAALIELRGTAALDILVNNSGCSWGEPLEEYQGSRLSNEMDSETLLTLTQHTMSSTVHWHDREGLGQGHGPEREGSLLLDQGATAIT